MASKIKKIYNFILLILIGVLGIGFGQWTPLPGPYGASDIRGLAICQSNPQTVYLASYGKGVFKSTDAGVTWSAKRNGLNDWLCQAIAVDPTDEDIVYVNTYWWGLFRSTDGGENWIQCLSQVTDNAAVAVNPIDPNIVYAGAGSSVYKSTDKGITWNYIGPGGNSGIVYSIAISQIEPQILYVASGYNGGIPAGLYKSTDGGSTWTHLTNGIPEDGASDVKIDPEDVNTVFATTASGIYRTTNGGADWSQVLVVADNYFKCLGIDPDSSNIIYAGASAWGIPWSHWSEGLFKSTDRGITWFESNNGLLDNNIQCFLTSSVSPSVLYLGTYNCNHGGSIGVYKSTDHGSAWFPSNTGITQSIWSIGLQPMTPQTIWACSQGGGVYKSEDDGLTWQQMNNGMTDQRVCDIALDPMDSNLIYIATSSYEGSGGIFRSTDCGENWTQTWNLEACSRIFADISRPNCIWAGAMYPGYILKSTDYGITWQNVFNTGNGQMIRSICVSPVDSQIIYVGNYDQLYKSGDGGSSWTDITPSINGEFNSIVIDPIEQEVVYVGVADWGDPLSSGVWKSTDGGTTWTQTCNVRKVGPLVMAPWDNLTLYLGSYWEGVFVTTDGGETWDSLNTGFEQTSLSILSLGLRDGVIKKAYAGLQVDGLFTQSIISIAEEKFKGPSVNKNKISLLEIFPNPFTRNTVIKLHTPIKTTTSLKIYNSAGQLVKAFMLPSTYSPDLAPGSEVDLPPTAVSWDGTDKQGNPVSAGIYFCQLKTDDCKADQKIIRLR